MNDFISILKQYQSVIWPQLNKYLENSQIFPPYCQINSQYTPLLDFHHQMITDYPRRMGKYLRPSLLMATALSMGVTQKEALLSAVAMQLSEEWILIHDDIQDQSEQRRGGPALNKIYGTSLAINAGDSLHVIMWKVISDINNPKISEEFYQLLNRTTFGQTVEIKWTEDNKLDITSDDVYLILESKTCYYTISGPMRLGAILAGATIDQLNIIYKFGLNLGRSFQIIDDLLDLTSDFSGLKKQSYNDIYEGKRTILLSHLLNSANPEELSEIKDIFSKNRTQKTEAEVKKIIELMKKYQTFEYAKSEAIKFASIAKNILDQDMPFIKLEPYRSQLESAIDFIVTRDH